MNELGIDTKFFQIPRDPVIKPGTDGHDQIGGIHRRVGGKRAMHAQHAQPQVVHARKAAQAHQGIGNRGRRQLTEAPQLRRGARENHPATRVEHRALRRRQHVRRPAYLTGMAFQSRLVAAHVHRIRIDKLAFTGRHILGDIHQHRSRTSGRGNEKRFFDRRGELSHVSHERIVFRTRMGNADDVRFLKGIVADHPSWHLTGEHHDRRRVHQRVGQPSHHIGATRSGRHQHHARLARGPRIALSHVHRALLVTCQNGSHTSLIKRIIDGQNGAARMPENRIHAFFAQTLDKNFRAIHEKSFPTAQTKARQGDHGLPERFS